MPVAVRQATHDDHCPIVEYCDAAYCWGWYAYEYAGGLANALWYVGGCANACCAAAATAVAWLWLWL